MHRPLMNTDFQAQGEDPIDWRGVLRDQRGEAMGSQFCAKRILGAPLCLSAFHMDRQ